MDENKSPQDILNEIFENAKEPTPPPQRSKFEYPPEEESLSFPLFKEVTEKSGTAQNIKIPLWLSVALGVALLILGVCVLQLVRVNDRLDSLQDTISGELDSVEQLRKENESLQASRDLLRERVQKAEDGTQNLRKLVQSLEEESESYRMQVTALNALWFVHQFIEAKDYPMAAIAVHSEYTRYRFHPRSDFISNPAIEEQFHQDCQPLIQQEYLTQFVDGTLRLTDHFYDQETAYPLVELWSILDSYYCDPYGDVEANLPILYFDQFGGAEYTFLQENCSEFTLQLYQQIVDDLVEEGQLQWENGRLVKDYNYSGTDIFYAIPEEITGHDS